MTLEYLEKQKEKYQNKSGYFSAIGFDGLANDFQKMVDLITKMEEYIKGEEEESNNATNNEN